MDPITIIAIAKGLATFAPSLMKMFGAKEPTVELATKVVDIGMQVTGAKSPSEALEMLNINTEKQLAFQQAVMDNETVLHQMYLKDTQDARARDIALAAAGKYNMRANLLVLFAFFLVAACLIAIFYIENSNEYAKASITLILGTALGWVNQVFNFDFGTTRSSAKQQDTINKLTDK